MIEKDRDLVPSLRERFPGVEVVEQDALDADWHALAGAGPFSVIGNIPYNITSPLIDRALKPPRPRRIVFLVQQEVADRIGAAPGSEDYGALSIGVQAVAVAERLFSVPAGAFRPAPRVDSAVVRLTPRPPPSCRIRKCCRSAAWWSGSSGSGGSSCSGACGSSPTGSPIGSWPCLRAAGLAPDIRPEVITPAEFARLHRASLTRGGRRARFVKDFTKPACAKSPNPPSAVYPSTSGSSKNSRRRGTGDRQL